MFLGEGQQILTKALQKKPVVNKKTQENLPPKNLPLKTGNALYSSKTNNILKPSKAANLENSSAANKFSQASRSPQAKQEAHGNLGVQKSTSRPALKGVVELKASHSTNKLTQAKYKRP